jgi:type III pantothenate kinase
MIGNSRLHWGYFLGKTLQHTWDTPHLSKSQTVVPFPAGLKLNGQAEILLASVVPEQTALWQNHPAVKVVTLDQIPLQGLYPTLGVDRALAVWGAGETLSWPVLVIDAGTALTFTGANANHRLWGGAILPGLKLQMQALNRGTAALSEVELPEQLPPRWALNTLDAIESGVIYSILASIQAFIEDWWQQFPQSAIALTGGDSATLLAYLQILAPAIATQVTADPHLIFWGLRSHYLALHRD